MIHWTYFTADYYTKQQDLGQYVLEELKIKSQKVGLKVHKQNANKIPIKRKKGLPTQIY